VQALERYALGEESLWLSWVSALFVSGI
jgi:hypothetical protein